MPIANSYRFARCPDQRFRIRRAVFEGYGSLGCFTGVCRTYASSTHLLCYTVLKRTCIRSNPLYDWGSLGLLKVSTNDSGRTFDVKLCNEDSRESISLHICPGSMFLCISFDRQNEKSYRSKCRRMEPVGDKGKNVLSRSSRFAVCGPLTCKANIIIFALPIYWNKNRKTTGSLLSKALIKVISIILISYFDCHKSEV